jgi:small-conductance mechanosensitive channel
MKMPGDATARTRDITLDTYRYLRGGMAVMIVMLGTAVIGERLMATCWQTSISAYYFTTAHSIFIAVLCALGVQFIVYKGSCDTEDVLLTLAGILAFIVAMVPTTRPVLLCGRYGLPADYAVKHAITNNVWAVVITLVIARVVSWSLYRGTNTTQPKSVWGTVSMYLLRVILAVGLIALIFFRNLFDSKAHGYAAVIMFLAIIATAGTTAFLVSRQDDAKSPHRHLYYVFYVGIAAAMIVTLIAVVVLHLVLDSWNHWVIVVETALILEFTVYWVIQTIELWKTPNRFELLPDADQSRLAQRRRTRGPAGLLPEVVEATRAPVRERLLTAL